MGLQGLLRGIALPSLPLPTIKFTASSPLSSSFRALYLHLPPPKMSANRYLCFLSYISNCK
jgi:hypothetical protein